MSVIATAKGGAMMRMNSPVGIKVDDEYKYSIAKFGLYRTTVGQNTGNHMMENVVSYAEQERIAEEKRLEEERKAEEERLAPAKFKDTVEKATGEPVAIPTRLASFMQGTKQSVPMGRDYASFKEYLSSLQ